jgi:hypothetical protein
MKRLEGNGDAEFKIILEEKRPGYVVFAPENLLDVGVQFYAHLSIIFSKWLKDNPGIRVRSTCPICDESGQTVILHVWFDRLVSP